MRADARASACSTQTTTPQPAAEPSAPPYPANLAGSQGDILGDQALNVGFGGVTRWRVIGRFRRVGHGARDVLALTQDRQPVLCALALERQDVGLVVADVVEQLVPDRPFVVEPPAP